MHGPEAVSVFDVSKQEFHEIFLGMVDQWRQRIHHAAVSSLTNPALGLFLGMVLGEQSYIEQDVRLYGEPMLLGL